MAIKYCKKVLRFNELFTYEPQHYTFVGRDRICPELTFTYGVVHILRRQLGGREVFAKSLVSKSYKGLVTKV